MRKIWILIAAISILCVTNSVAQSLITRYSLIPDSRLPLRSRLNITIPVDTTALPLDTTAVPLDTTALAYDPELLPIDTVAPTDTVFYESLTDSLFANVTELDTLMSAAPLPISFFVVPPVFTSYIMPPLDTVPASPFTPDYSGNPGMQWIEDLQSVSRRREDYIQRLALYSPFAINYNQAMLPEAPKKYDVVINPDDYTINVVEIKELAKVDETITGPEIQKRHWPKTFNAALQFSQAYISPNWYQGGINNLNMLLNLNYNVKLNQQFHPNYLVEFNAQYKLGMNNAPDDSVHNYNISEDLLQLNTTLGYKAASHWYYTVNAMFKTQLLNAYGSNSRALKSAFLSPGEFNAGIGMTYNMKNQSGTFALDASISPLSYNMRMCYNHKLDPTKFGVDAGHRTKSTYGSNVECKISYKISNNISLKSRLFAFTDYDRAYADLENAMVFEINKFLTTQLFVNLRYDTDTPPSEDGWHNLQLKEILSLGFAYKFSSI